MEIYQIQIASQFLTRSDLVHCCLVTLCSSKTFRQDLRSLREKRPLPQCLLLGSARAVAATIISKWLQTTLMKRWLNRVAWEGARKHCFPHRTETNYKPWREHFRGGLAGIERIMTTLKFTPQLKEIPLCPECQSAPVSAAWWRHIGDCMPRSSPYLHVGCESCAISLGGYCFSMYAETEPGIITFYQNYKPRSFKILQWVRGKDWWADSVEDDQ